MLSKKPYTKIIGLTLLETMMALAVGAVVLMSAVIYYASSRQNANVTKVVADMNAIMAAYRSYIAQGNNVCVVRSSSCSGPTTLSILQTATFLPSPMNDPWGQSYTATSSSPGGKMFIVITVPGIGSADEDKTCNAILQIVNNGNTLALDATGKIYTMPEGTCQFTYNL
jgi:type II secretory pathway pseudopilin PulG